MKIYFLILILTNKLLNIFDFYLSIREVNKESLSARKKIASAKAIF